MQIPPTETYMYDLDHADRSLLAYMISISQDHIYICILPVKHVLCADQADHTEHARANVCVRSR